MKKVIFAIAAVVASASLHASYLYWQIDGSEDVSALGGAEYDGARVFAENDSTGERTYLNIAYGSAGDTLVNVGDKINVPLHDSVVAVFDPTTYGSGYTFYIELINYADATPVGQSEGQTYAQLNNSEFVGTDLSPVSMAVWHGGAYSSVPEPTSAMLVLFGLAGLALRRRAV